MRTLKVCLFGIPFCGLLLLIVSSSVQAQSLTWQILPWYQDANWGAQTGSPAITNGNQMISSGQPVRSVQTFTLPSTVTFDLYVQSVWHLNPDGQLWFYFMPPGQPTNLFPSPGLHIDTTVPYSGNNAVQVSTRTNGVETLLWSGGAVSLSLQTTNHMAIGVSATGQLTYWINGQSLPIPNTVVMPYSQFQIEIGSFQPGGDFRISNLTVIPEPSAFQLAALGLAVFGFVARRCLVRRSRR